MADAVISVLLEKLVSLLESEGRQLLKFDDQFEETKKELKYMQSYLKDADQVKRKDRSETLKMVMSNLRELVYNAEDVIADCQLLFQKKHQECAPNFTSYCFPTLSKSHHQLGKRLRKINQEAMKVKENMQSYLQTVPRQTGKDEDRGNVQLPYPILIDEAELVGLEDDSTKIKNWILEANGPSTVIGIVGMLGIGKTTLAQKICDSVSVKNSFKHSFFVTISQNLKFNELVKTILRKLNVEDESVRGNDDRDLLEKLKSELNEKYLVVLDDVWRMDEGMWWDSLKSALPGVSGSCVIVTTRNEEVAKSMGATDERIHHPQILSDIDSWSLFSKVAFARNGGECMKPDLVEVGKEIVSRCMGLPLTIKVVGGMMLGKGDSIHEWRRISEHLKEELAITKKDELVISRLELSYEELPTHLKPCFLCLAMFPEDFEISVADMVDWWIGEGFVWGRNGKTAFENGEECFTELFNRFLILGVHKDEFERRFIRCKMHDMVREMVIKIAREESFIVSLDHGDGRPEVSVSSRRVGIVRNTVVGSIENSSTSLRTLVGVKIESTDIIVSVKAKRCKGRWLRVLSLSLSSIEMDNDWLSRIGSFQHLVYLRIHGSALRKLPNSIGHLSNLQILSLRQCNNLLGFPPSIMTLEKLTAIKIIDCASLECMPKGLEKLSNLEQLLGFRPVNSGHKNGSGISQLKNLKRLGQLWMDIKSEEQIEEGELNELSMLQHLQVLWLKFDGNSLKNDALVRKIDCHLSPPLKSLRELRLGYYIGERTPVWLNPISLPNLQFLYIYGGTIRQMGPGFLDSERGVWKVEVLVLQVLEEMDEEWSRIRKAMPSLRLLKVYRCPKLKSFPFDVTVDDRKWRIWREVEEKGASPFEGAHSTVEEEEEEEEEEGTSIQEIQEISSV